jgi:hypothetical protein
MENNSRSNGWQTFWEHWSFMLMAVVAVLTGQVLEFFSRLTGTPWIWCYGVGLAIAAVGVSLILYAKLPLYRQRRFLTFGSRVLPENRRPLYRWGYRCVLVAMALLLCLFLSRP